jgi:hypothetical protein
MGTSFTQSTLDINLNCSQPNKALLCSKSKFCIRLLWVWDSIGTFQSHLGHNIHESLEL